MTTVLLTILSISILTFIAVLVCCTLLTARDSGSYKKNVNKRQGGDNVFSQKQLCSKCKTGKYTYELDRHSETCPYMGCFRGNECQYYRPLEKTSKAGVSAKK